MTWVAVDAYRAKVKSTDIDRVFYTSDSNDGTLTLRGQIWFEMHHRYYAVLETLAPSEPLASPYRDHPKLLYTVALFDARLAEHEKPWPRHLGVQIYYHDNLDQPMYAERMNQLGLSPGAITLAERELDSYDDRWKAHR